MRYPTIEAVEKASRYQICEWIRFLHSPGMDAINAGLPQDKLDEAREREIKVMDRICVRMGELGGFTPEISKALGWEER